MEFRTLHNSTLTMEGMVNAEVIRSVEEFPFIGDEEASIRKLLDGRLHSKRLLVLNNRIFAHASFLDSNHRKSAVQMLLGLSAKLPNFVILMSSTSFGRCITLDEEILPTLVFAKKGGYRDCGIMVSSLVFSFIFFTFFVLFIFYCMCIFFNFYFFILFYFLIFNFIF